MARTKIGSHLRLLVYFTSARIAKAPKKKLFCHSRNYGCGNGSGIRLLSLFLFLSLFFSLALSHSFSFFLSLHPCLLPAGSSGRTHDSDSRHGYKKIASLRVYGLYFVSLEEKTKSSVTID